MLKVQKVQISLSNFVYIYFLIYANDAYKEIIFVYVVFFIDFVSFLLFIFKFWSVAVIFYKFKAIKNMRKIVHAVLIQLYAHIINMITNIILFYQNN